MVPGPSVNLHHLDPAHLQGDGDGRAAPDLPFEDPFRAEREGTARPLPHHRPSAVASGNRALHKMGGPQATHLHGQASRRPALSAARWSYQARSVVRIGAGTQAFRLLAAGRTNDLIGAQDPGCRRSQRVRRTAGRGTVHHPVIRASRESEQKDRTRRETCADRHGWSPDWKPLWWGLYRGLICLIPNSGKNFWFRQRFPPGSLCRAIPDNSILASFAPDRRIAWGMAVTILWHGAC